MVKFSTLNHHSPFDHMVTERKGLASGLIVGLFVGIVFDNIALGIVFGLLFGGVFDYRQKNNADAAE